jgi:hypothetical protein
MTPPDKAGVNGQRVQSLLAGARQDGFAGQQALIPREFNLYQNYPNPFNPTTTISFNLPKASNVILKVFNILGEEVATLVSKRLPAGSHSYQWSNTEGIASGVYLYRLEADGFVRTRKMILLE